MSNKLHIFCRQCILFGLFFWSGTTTNANTQIVPDNTLGVEASRVTPSVLINGGSADRIEGGAIRDVNLFHSFREFNVGDGQRVYFANPSGIQNILTRVTGTNSSNIFGTLGVDGGANLFLINPNGILFGQNSSLDVRGSFVGTTGNAVEFADGNLFSANPSSSNNLLTISVPVGLQMGLQPGKIENLSVNGLFAGSGLSLVAGEISFDGGYLIAVASPLELAAVGVNPTNLKVGINPANPALLTLPEGISGDINLVNSARIFGIGDSNIKLVTGNINLDNRAVIYGTDDSNINLFAGNINLDNRSVISGIDSAGINVNGTDVNLNNSTILGAGSVGISVNGTRVNLNNSSILGADSVGINVNGTNFNLNNSTISGINGAEVNINGANFNLNNSRLFSNNQGTGKGGDINIQVSENVNIRDSQILSSTFTDGSNGDINIQAGGNVNIRNSRILANTFASGTGGDINITGANIDIAGDGVNYASTAIANSANDQGKAGNLTLTARDTINITDDAAVYITTSGSGDSGDLTLQANNRINLTNNAAIASNTTGSGKGGDLKITTGSLRLENTPTRGIFVYSSNTGASGGITIKVDDTTEVIDSPILTVALSVNISDRAGNISIETGKLKLENGGRIDGSTFGSADGGDITITAKESIQISGKSPTVSSLSSIFSRTGLDGTGNAGSITVNTPRLSLSQGGTIGTFSLRSSGNSGNITIRSQDVEVDGFVVFDPNNLASSPDGSYATTSISTEIFVGQSDNVTGGNINIETERLRLSNGGTLESSIIAGRGKAGNIFVKATDSIDISGVGLRNRDGIPLSSGLFAEVQTNGIGVGGNIEVVTNRLGMSDNGQISAASFAQGNTGNILISANQINMQGEYTLISNQISSNAVGNSGVIRIDTQSLNLQAGGFITSATLGQGNAGNLIINADIISMQGELTFITSSVGTTGKGNGGDLQITANQLNLLNGAYITSSSLGNGQAGSILLKGKNQVRLEGERSRITVESRSQSPAGNIQISTPSLQLFDNSLISAESLSQDGGNITIDNANFVLLRQGSQISATAGEGGNGGNINIQAKAIAAIPRENSDIRANAVRGRGGNVNITTKALFGIVPATQPTNRSDITASSELGIGGEVTVTKPDLDPTQGLVELAEGLADQSHKIGGFCPRNAQEAEKIGEFTVTGRGGIAQGVFDPLIGSHQPDLATYIGDVGEEGMGENLSNKPEDLAIPQPIVEAQGWVKTPDGKVILVAKLPQTDPTNNSGISGCVMSKE
ncbi:two-partner secretion domain-containing protein [Calothrix sp. NIES-3974]|uniref:two-partner secretion domain-containing protein n=1 Tax=Calothrix sp. NIES-3974 TaxID=2005462 RepID=UPI000B5FF4D6|nr:filamentous hemagglutinin N-terminal domain-containing protein [Calothrix sp. NIES-3974]BAZ07574.1 filamentous hemagglutinin outer membrane protein [Calothrix sp. NIES-3974]